MLTQDIYVYIAAPFFNEAQLTIVQQIERILEHNKIRFFSPRLDGVIKEMEKAERDVKIEAIYRSNIIHIEECNFMIAVIDDYDTGTVFELGWMSALQTERDQRIVTVTGNNYELNVMLKFPVHCHIKGIQELEELILDIRMDGGTDGVALELHSAPPEIVK